MSELVSEYLVTQKIFFIRGQKVMLSTDLAKLYGVEPKALVQAVKRNPERFPSDFMFSLNAKEFANLKSQFVTSSWGGSRRAFPYAFTEYGVAMLSSVLRSKRAIQVNIEIMRAFSRLREILASHRALARRLDALEKKVGAQDEKIQAVFDAIRELMKEPENPKRKIGFTAQEKNEGYKTPRKMQENILFDLLQRLEEKEVMNLQVVPGNWAPIPVFGDYSQATVATLGLNPSNLEYEDKNGKELDGEEKRRFHTFESLGISSWGEVRKDKDLLNRISNLCRDYFKNNPYRKWFDQLEEIISGTGASFYDQTACHLDLVPLATNCKWRKLSIEQKTLLLEIGKSTLARIICVSPIRLLILNGETVIREFREITAVHFRRTEMPSWALSRSGRKKGKGYSYIGTITVLSGIDLKRELLVLGFNHNIQSSFGVTNVVKGKIRDWVTEVSKNS